MDPHLKAILDSEFGGHFDPAAVDPELRFAFDHPCRVANDALSQAYWQDGAGRHPHRLRVGFFESEALDAGTADTGTDESIVAISHALPVELLGAIARLADAIDPETMLPRRDGSGRLIVFSAPIRWERSLAGPQVSAASLKPALEKIFRDLAARGVLAQSLLLYDLAIRFVVMHECMHIVLGHTAYAARELGLVRLMEGDAGRRSRMPAVPSQALEFIADRHTIHGLTHWARTGRLGDYAQATAVGASVDQEVFMMRALTLSLMSLLHLFPNREHARDCAGDSHPHPYQRMRWWCREMTSALDDGELCVKGVFEPLAYWLASFQTNVIAPGKWSPAVLEDEPDGEGTLLSDRGYEQMTGAAREWQTRIWKAHGPLYPGDSRVEDAV